MVEGQQIKMLHHLAAGSFIELDHCHLMFTEPMVPCDLVVGMALPLSCMFEIHEVLLNGKPVGWAFTTSFFCRNEGGYIVTFSRSGAGRATEAEVLVKTEQLVVFHFPNRGTLVISPKVNQNILTVFEEQ